MLVVIVVAAATAFSFFVATYQKQLQAQEALEHDKALEKVRILSLQPTTYKSNPDLVSLLVELASLDVNPIGITSILLTGHAVVEYNVTDAAGSSLASGCLSGNPYAAATAICTLDLPAESQVFIQLDLNLNNARTSNLTQNHEFSLLPSTTESFTVDSVLGFEILTSLGNEFTESFVPPVAVAGISFISGYPILDGSNSYQPAEGATSNVTIEFWNWTVSAFEIGNDTNACTSKSPATEATDCGMYIGQEVELGHPFSANVTYPTTPHPTVAAVAYSISLKVTDSESLIGTAQITYQFSS